MNEVTMTKAGWAALRFHLFGEEGGVSTGGVTNAVNQGVLVRTEVGIAVTELGRQVAARVWGV